MAQFEEARRYNQESLDLAREVGDRRGAADALNRLGGVCASLGQYAQAKQYHQEALDIYRAMGDRRGTGNSLALLGTAQMSLGEYDEARMCFQESLDVRREVGNPADIADSLGFLALIAALTNDFDTAHHRNEESHRVLEESHVHDPALNVRYHLFRAIIALFQDDFETARQISEDFLPQLEAAGVLWAVSQVQFLLGLALHGLSRLEEAQQRLKTALRTGIDTGALDWAASSLMGLGRALADAGQVERGVELITLARNFPATQHFMRHMGDQWLAQLEPALAPDTLAAAVERGKRLDFNAVVAQLLAEQAD
jgi:tetratricopeptide (TPR) repeat protein